MNTTIDDLSAVRIIYDALVQLDEPTRERVLRWVNEKLGTAIGSALTHQDPKVERNTNKRSVGRPKTSPRAQVQDQSEKTSASQAVSKPNEGLAKFLATIKPKTANQIIIATALYHKEASGADRRTSIDSADVEEAYRAMDKNVPTYIGQLLITAKNAGYMKNTERGRYALTVLGDEILQEATIVK